MSLAEFVVSFREFFEIALLVGIILAYLYKTGNTRFNRFVYLGVVLAVLASIASAFAFETFAGGFEANEALFEGVLLVVASLFVTWLLVWMLQQTRLRERIHQKLKVTMDEEHRLGLVLFAFVAVFREGVEVVLFLGGISLSTGSLNAFSVVLGALAAVLLAYVFFSRLAHLDLNRFFKYTSLLLLLLAAGLFSQGIHELQEANVLPTFVEHVYNVNPPVSADGSYPFWHEKGLIGGVLKGMVGYDGNPSALQLLAYALYVGSLYLIYTRYSKHRGF
ncbi:FTR1 family protein [Candidatus Micrarchaeota archaeon]|nr:FTR1 family protein [Candidatus Micrarchaeota archaeon]